MDLEITPSQLFLRRLPTQVVDISHQGLGPKGARACALALYVSCNDTLSYLEVKALELNRYCYYSNHKNNATVYEICCLRFPIILQCFQYCCGGLVSQST